MPHKLFKNLIVSYLLMSLIPILTGLLAYRQAAASAQNKTYDMLNMMVENAEVTMSGVFAETKSTLTRLSIDPAIRRLARSMPITETSTATFLMHDARNLLSRNKLVNENLIDLVLYCERPDAIITTSHIFIRTKDYYDAFFRYGEMDITAWSEQVLSAQGYEQYYPEQSLLFRINTDGVQTQRALVYAQQISTTPYKGKLMAYVSTERLNKLLTDQLLDYNGWMVIRDASGRVLVSLGEVAGDVDFDTLITQGNVHASIGGTPVHVVHTTAANGWQYIATLDRTQVLSDINMLTLTMWTMIAAEVVLLAIFALLLTRRSVKPIEGLMELLSKEQPESTMAANEFEYIEQAILQLQRHKAEMQSQLDQNLPLVRARLMAQLLNGYFGDQRSLRDQFAAMSLRMPEPEDTLMVFRIGESTIAEEPARIVFSRMMTREYLRQHEQDQHYVSFPMDMEHIAVLFAKEDAREDAKALADALYEYLLAAEAEVPLVAVSVEPGELQVRYISAYSQLGMLGTQPGVVQWVHQAEGGELDHPWYPLRIEENLIQLVMAGDSESVSQLLNRIQKENFSRRDLPAARRKALYYAFIQTMERILQEIPSTQTHGAEDFWDLRPEVMLRSANPMQSFSRWCIEATQFVEQKRTDTDAHQFNDIMRYLNEHYCDSQLSLGTVAKAFGFSETYFSRMFKSIIGINYSECLEKLRIEKACTLLRKGLTVDEITAQVGYNSVTVFRSAFKRITGVTPSVYRSNLG